MRRSFHGRANNKNTSGKLNEYKIMRFVTDSNNHLDQLNNAQMNGKENPEKKEKLKTIFFFAPLIVVSISFLCIMT